MANRILKSIAFFSFVLLLVGQALVPVRAESKPGDQASMTFKPVLYTMKYVNDSAGSWIHQGGTVYKGAAQVGYFIGTMRRTPTGTVDQKLAFATGTLIFSGSKPPQNLTVQGVCDLTIGKFLGSVSSATSAYKTWIGAQVQGNSDGSLTITK